ncbi:MAG TPA: pilus assembly protein PilM [Solirubrobacteraceae bacterium]|jgi:type IV pilus assembly protein PilM|nr:pilus assembly protein PilM [Solirubrobacteraceae bacterium]
MRPSLPSLPSTSLKLPKLPHRSHGTDVVGLDVQPGLVAAVKARVNGSILAERAAAQPLDADTVREGEVVDVEALTEALRELFSGSGLGKRVRVGLANQRTVMRTIDLPPVTDRKELAAAVRFQAQDQVPMPLSNAVLDFHPLGVFDTPTGARQRVVLVAAQRDMVERLLAAVRGAGLTPEGVDLSAFALIRSLHDRAESAEGRVLYLNVDGLTNLAIAEGTICRFTRVVGGGVEAMAGELAARREISLTEARRLLATVDLGAPVLPGAEKLRPAQPVDEAVAALEQALEQKPVEEQTQTDEQVSPDDASQDSERAEVDGQEPQLSREEHEARELSMGYAETISATQASAPASPAADRPSPEQDSDSDIRTVLENSVREIAGEVRNSLDFHRTQEQGGEIAHVSLSGAALDLPGFAEALQSSLGIEVRQEVVGLADASLEGKVSTHRLAVAAGLAATEAPR